VGRVEEVAERVHQRVAPAEIAAQLGISDGIPVGSPTDKWTLRPWPRKGAHMRKSRFTETQIVAVLKRLKAGAKAADVCREFGISETTLYNWRAKYGGA
jgi:hypothetical protein